MSQTIWIARHGNRQDFVDRDWRLTAERPYDPGLSPDGIEQAKLLGQRLIGEGITHLFASPFLRTVETAHYIAEAIDLEIKVEAGLSEFLNPEWFPAMPEKLTLEELADRFPRVDRHYQSRVIATYPETEAETFQRAGDTARKLAAEFPADILLVGHGASVLGATRGLTGNLVQVNCALCCLFKLVLQENSWVMELEGDVSHLGETEAVIRFN